MNDRQPSVSIVIPCYDSAAFLREAIDSALAQTLPPLEVIIVDDGSSDASAEIAATYGPPVRLIRQTNQGPSIARNVGVADSRGQYLLFLDADDLLAPDALRRLLLAIEHKSNCVGLMACAVFDESIDRPLTVDAKLYESFFPHVIRGHIRTPICWLTPRSLFDRVGGFTDETRPSEDWDFWGQIALTGADIESIDYVGAFYRRHEQSVMSTVTTHRRALGHVNVMERLGNGIVRDGKLMERWGEEMFWAGWSAIHGARRIGVPWEELRGLSRVLQRLARGGPAQFRSSRFAKCVSIIGVPLAELVRNVFVRPSASQHFDRQSAAPVSII